MREEDSNWFSKWEQELPSPEELIPLSQSLITPDLAVAFNLQISNHRENVTSVQTLPQTTPSSAVDETTPRTLKRPRLVWTPQLHKRFVDAVAHIGIKNAVPKTIMQLMSVDGLTRENVASHLQKYRLYLKRMQSGGGGGGGGGGGNVVGESDYLFASSPVPTHFLHPTTTRQNSPSFVPISTLPPPNLFHRRIPAVNLISPANNEKVMDQSLFMSMQSQQQQQALREAYDSGDKTVLTLFPTKDD